MVNGVAHDERQLAADTRCCAQPRSSLVDRRHELKGSIEIERRLPEVAGGTLDLEERGGAAQLDGRPAPPVIVVDPSGGHGRGQGGNMIETVSNVATNAARDSHGTLYCVLLVVN